MHTDRFTIAGVFKNGTLYDLQEKVADSDLEEAYKLKGYRCFGKIIRLSDEQVEVIRQEIIRRNHTGEYIYKNASERARMRKRATTLV